MNQEIILDLSKDYYTALWRHLQSSQVEEAAFAYAQPMSDRAGLFRVVDWQPVPAEGFVYQTEIGFEITDEMRGLVIKRAHDLDASLVEFHSHKVKWPAEFSPSDLYGFTEFVPHVWWRLKSKPYFSVVVSSTDFDAFGWITDPKTPQYLDALAVAGEIYTPTKLSALTLSDYNYERTL